MVNYQTRLFQAIWDDSGDKFAEQGIAIYRNNLIMNAERALAITYPTVVLLVGEEFFSLLVREFIQQEKLYEGDWGMWGKTFPQWLSTDERLVDYPYISDCAYVDWLCHIAERAQVESRTFVSDIPRRLDLSSLSIDYCAGANLLQSTYPVVDIWQAHQIVNEHERHDLISQAKQKISEGVGQIALVWRPQWQARVREVNTVESEWLINTFNGSSIKQALENVNPLFSLADWLHQSTSDGLVTGFY